MRMYRWFLSFCLLLLLIFVSISRPIAVAFDDGPGRPIDPDCIELRSSGYPSQIGGPDRHVIPVFNPCGGGRGSGPGPGNPTPTPTPASCTITLGPINLCQDLIRTVLSPASRSGTFKLTLRHTGGGETTLVNENRSGGTYNDSFALPTLPNGTVFTEVKVSWCDDTSEMSAYMFKKLGIYLHSSYNIPDESTAQCNSAQQQYCYSSRNNNVAGSCNLTDCEEHTAQAKSLWISETEENGSGSSIAFGSMTRESFCRLPAGCNAARWFRDIDDDIDGCPSCDGLELVTNQTVARNAGNPDLPCGAIAFIHDPNGGGLSGCKTVTDAGGGLQLTQLDHFVGTAGCNVVPQGNANLHTAVLLQ